MALSITAKKIILQEIGFQNKIRNQYTLFVLDLYLWQYLMIIRPVPGQVLLAVDLSNAFIPIVIPLWCWVQIAWIMLLYWLQIAVEIKLGLIAHYMKLDQPNTFLHQWSISPGAIQSHRASKLLRN